MKEGSRSFAGEINKALCLLSILFKEVWIPFTVDDPVETDAHLCSMRLINVKAFLERENLIRKRKRVDRRAKVLEFGDD